MGHLTLYLKNFRTLFARSKTEKSLQGKLWTPQAASCRLNPFNGLNGLTTMTIISLTSQEGVPQNLTPQVKIFGKEQKAGLLNCPLLRRGSRASAFF